MAKRFTDTEKFKKPFIRGLQGAYKLLWDFICHDCDHAGIWHVDFEIAQIYIGQDMLVNEEDALSFFNKGERRIEIINTGEKWFIRPFIEFQYGTLNPENKVHKSILDRLTRSGIKPLGSPLRGAKDKDKDKDKEKDKDKDRQYEISFGEFWDIFPSRNGKKLDRPAAKKKFYALKAGDLANVILAVINYAESEMIKKGIGIKDPHRFLSNKDNPEYWKEWIEAEDATVEDINSGPETDMQKFMNRENK